MKDGSGIGMAQNVLNSGGIAVVAANRYGSSSLCCFTDSGFQD